MRIKSLKLTNFGSYRNENTFDFVTSNGRDGYAIFGEIGSGKTSMVNGLLWCLYGHISTKDLISDYTRKRPIIDAEQLRLNGSQKENPPLLNSYAFQEEDYNMSVRLVFDYEGKDGKIREYSLYRESLPKRKKARPQNDGDMVITPHLSIDGKNINADSIIEKINDVIHEDISKFFFVEGDNINNFSHLLFAEFKNKSIVDDIESILGLPALDKSVDDFDWLTGLMDDKLIDATKDIKKAKKTNQQIKKIDEKISDITTSIDTTNQLREQYKERNKEIIQQLEDDINVAALVQEQKSAKINVDKIKKEIDEWYEKRREQLSSNLWLCLIQDKLTNSLNKLEEKKKILGDLQEKLFNANSKLNSLSIQIIEGQSKCSVCGNIDVIIDDEDKEEKTKLISNLNIEIIKINKKRESIGNPDENYNKLLSLKKEINYDLLKTIEDEIYKKIIALDTLEKRVKEINDSLMDHDVIKIANLQLEKNENLLSIASFDRELAKNNKQLEEQRKSRKNLLATLSNVIESEKVSEIKLQKNVYEWLSSQFKGAMQVFKEDARISVEEISTAGFLKMIPSKIKKAYSKVTINENWNVVLHDADERATIVANPGTRQILSLAVFNGLRKTSNLQFPTFFDNPGASISNVSQIADYFWEDDSGQMVMLSHPGGLKKELTIENYGSRLARSWELTYKKDTSNLITSIQVIN